MLYLAALTLATFGIGTGEYVIMGLLPELAAELHVSIPRAGFLVSAYALGVVVGGPVMAILTANAPRKPTLQGLLVLFIAGNAACALAPGYGFLLWARVLTALCHGTFFGVASVVASDLAPPEHRGRAIATVFMGITLANMLGVPAGTALGHAFGWRSTFWAVGGIGCAALLALTLLLPRTIPLRLHNPLTELRPLKQPRELVGLLLSMLTSASLFVVFTYIAPLLRDVTGVSSEHIPTVLFIMGVGLTLGSVLGGKLGDKNLIRSLLALMAVGTGVLILLRPALPHLVPAVAVLFVWSMCAFAINPMLQVLVVRQAGDTPSLASTFNQSAFNLGNALGAWMGGALLGAGAALIELPLAAALVLLAALLVTLGLRRPEQPGA